MYSALVKNLLRMHLLRSLCVLPSRSSKQHTAPSIALRLYKPREKKKNWHARYYLRRASFRCATSTPRLNHVPLKWNDVADPHSHFVSELALFQVLFRRYFLELFCIRWINLLHLNRRILVDQWMRFYRRYSFEQYVKRIVRRESSETCEHNSDTNFHKRR